MSYHSYSVETMPGETRSFRTMTESEEFYTSEIARLTKLLGPDSLYMVHHYKTNMRGDTTVDLYKSEGIKLIEESERQLKLSENTMRMNLATMIVSQLLKSLESKLDNTDILLSMAGDLSARDLILATKRMY